MTEKELQKYLQERFPCENEACDWKEFKNLKHLFNGKEGDDVISYVAAISSMNGGHLVIGVKDHSLDIIGTDTYNYDPQTSTLRLVRECPNLPTEGLKIEEFITSDTNRKVWVINIPRHMPRLPVYAHKKLWQRVEDNLVEMSKSRLDCILNESLAVDDWSAQIIPDATIDDLEPKAISVAREKYKELFNGARDAEIDSWTDEVFLNKAKLTRKSAITRTTIILLGRPESDHFLNPSISKVRWFLRDERDSNKNFKVFTIPMILAIEEIGSIIRNTTYTYTVSGSMFPESMSRYDTFTLREPLNNAIAHQDYSRSSHIDVIEYEDEKLCFSIADIMLLDSVQKGNSISREAANYLRKKGYVEGRYPNVFLSSKVVAPTQHVGLKASYIKNRSFDDDYFKRLILDYIREYGKAERIDLFTLIGKMLPEYMTDQQRYDKLTNLLSALKRKGKVIYNGKYWLLVK